MTRAERRPLRRLAPVMGGVLSLAALVWLGWRMAGEVGPLLAAITWRLALVLLVAALVYAVLGLLLATAWWWLSRVYGDRPRLLHGIAVWSRSQLAKYLPGNVFHYVSRQLLGRRAGLSHQSLLAGHVLESLCLFLAAGLLAAVALLGGDGRAAGEDAHLLRWLLLLVLAAVALLAWPVVDRIARRMPVIGPWMAELPHLDWHESFRRFTLPLLLQAVFFAGTAALLHAIDLAWRGASLPWPGTVWVFALAWSLGTVTPGAPGGLGVREAALAVGLEELAGVDPAYAAGIALALRVVTMLGDGFLYLGALTVTLPEATPTRSMESPAPDAPSV